MPTCIRAADFVREGTQVVALTMVASAQFKGATRALGTKQGIFTICVPGRRMM